MKDKFILKSKTIIGLILATVVLWGPQFGLNFEQSDADGLMANLNELIVTAGIALAGFGRIVADSKLRIGLGSDS